MTVLRSDVANVSVVSPGSRYLNNRHSFPGSMPAAWVDYRPAAFGRLGAESRPSFSIR